MLKGKQEGREEEAIGLLLRLLNRRFGELEPSLTEQIQALDVSELEALAEALLDFATVADLECWLQQSNVQQARWLRFRRKHRAL